MSSPRHEIPTHLAVADKAFGGLTMRQLLSGAIGLALAYGAASDLPLVLPARFGVAGVVLLATALLVLWRPAGRPLEDWVFVLLRYLATPRVAVWRPREPSERRKAPLEVVLREHDRAGIAAYARGARAGPALQPHPIDEAHKEGDTHAEAS